jgi:FlaA1/EpsC-like NDP-sugar epimerase
MSNFAQYPSLTDRTVLITGGATSIGAWRAGATRRCLSRPT